MLSHCRLLNKAAPVARVLSTAASRAGHIIAAPGVGQRRAQVRVDMWGTEFPQITT